MSPSVWYETLRLFFNALTTDEKYSGSIMKNLQQLIHTPLSPPKKTFSEFFIEFPEMCMKFRAFSKKRWVS